MTELWVSVFAGLRDAGLAVTTGALLFVATVAPVGGRAASRAMTLARVAGVIWLVAAVAHSIASYSDIARTPVTADSFGTEWWAFLTGIGLGQVYLQIIIAAALTTLAAALVERPTGAAWALAPVLWALVVLSITGHASGAVDHHLAVSAMGVHIAAASVWLGLVVALLVARRGTTEGLRDLVLRVSRSVGWAAALVAVSGGINAYLRLGKPSDLVTTDYGRVLVAKVLLTGAVVALGALYRARYLSRLDDASVASRFGRLLAVEAGLFGAIVALAVWLSSMAPPTPIVPITDASPAWILTGYDLPPEPTAWNWIGQWRFELITALGIAVAAGVYLRWVRRLHRRGDRWPVHRTVLWLFGLLLLAWVTQGGPAIYGMVLFSGHMVQHMFLVMMVPLPLTLAAPVTLALRALPHRSDGSRGPREWLLAFVESRFIRLLANPVVAAVNFAGSMFVFYYTPVFRWVLENHIGHVWMVVHFVAVGYFFVNALVGVDPGVRRPPYAVRVVLLFATMAFHAFFGVALMMSTALLVPRWFGLMGRPWGPDALADQQIGGQIAWGIGELPVLILAIGVIVMWRRDDARVAARADRQADRDGDAELKAYNAMLQRIGERDGEA